MFNKLEGFQLWAMAQIVGSLSWPVSFVTVSSLAVFIDLSEPSLPIIWLLGFVMGGITALSSGLFVRRQISGPWKWAIANFVGIPVSLTVAYLIFPFATSPFRFATVGFCSGLLASGAQSLALKRGQGRVAPLVSGAFGWAFAFLFGYLLVVKEPTATFVLMPSDFFSVLLLGWGASGPVLLILLIGLSPLSHDRTSSGSGITYN
ncbi:MAG TPA: hypothetical protein VKA94_11310 [Hyphomicrobiales bacterium]|nr:hypothetical protein [Hyphomicrobiales bacterium]